MAGLSFKFRDILDINIQLINAFKFVDMAEEKFPYNLSFQLYSTLKS